MAIAEVLGGVGWWWPQIHAENIATLNFSQTPRSWVFAIPRTGNLVRIGLTFNTGSNASTVSFREVNSDGTPGTILASTTMSPTGLGFNLSNDFSPPLAVVQGQLRGVTLQTVGVLANQVMVSRGLSKPPYEITGTTKSDNAAMLVCEYDNGTHYGAKLSAPPLDGFGVPTSIAVGSEVGMLFEAPQTMLCTGGSVRCAVNGGFRIALYDEADTVLGESTWTFGQSGSTGALATFFQVPGFWPAITLAQGDTYRLTLRVEDGEVKYQKFAISDEVTDLALGPFTSRSGGGAWSDDVNHWVSIRLHLLGVGP